MKTKMGKETRKETRKKTIKKKRYISAGLCIVLLISLFTCGGCQKKEEEKADRAVALLGYCIGGFIGFPIPSSDETICRSDR
ncbi:hypothetical protein [Dorea sp.]